MKINIEFDLTPEEFRNLMGWPDLHAWQKQVLSSLDKNSDAGGHDAFSAFKPIVADSMQTMETFQKIMLEGFTQYLKSHSVKPTTNNNEGDDIVKKETQVDNKQ